MQLEFPVVLLVMMVVVFLFSMWRTGRRVQGAPRQLANLTRRNAWMMLAMGAVVFMCGVFAPSYLFMGLGALLVASSAYEISRRPRVPDMVSNWVYDAGKCGRCGYTLTHVASPTMCPECGWSVPPAGTRAQRADWPLWWKRWEIDYLDHPRKKLVILAANLLLFVVVMVGSVVFFGLLNLAVMAFIMALHLGINALRVVMYMQRERRARVVAER